MLKLQRLVISDTRRWRVAIQCGSSSKPSKVAKVVFYVDSSDDLVGFDDLDDSKKLMRLDKFLKASRIIKRRPIAKAVCDSGRVLVNDHPAKAGKELHEGDILRVNLSSRILTCKILSIPTGNVRAADASSLYEVISEETIERDIL